MLADDRLRLWQQQTQQQQQQLHNQRKYPALTATSSHPLHSSIAAVSSPSVSGVVPSSSRAVPSSSSSSAVPTSPAAHLRLDDVRLPTGRCARLWSACRSVASFILRLLLLLLSLVALLSIAQHPSVLRLLGWDHPTVFCPSAPSSSTPPTSSPSSPACIPCPANGLCDASGHLLCDPTYFRQGDQCVKDSAFLKGAVRLKGQALQRLQQHAGRFECGQEEQRGYDRHSHAKHRQTCRPSNPRAVRHDS
jgi:hypothetical protein